MEDDNLWTPRELAKFLGYTESTISRMVSQCPDRLPRLASWCWLGRGGFPKSLESGREPAAICRLAAVAVPASFGSWSAGTGFSSIPLFERFTAYSGKGSVPNPRKNPLLSKDIGAVETHPFRPELGSIAEHC